MLNNNIKHNIKIYGLHYAYYLALRNSWNITAKCLIWNEFAKFIIVLQFINCEHGVSEISQKESEEQLSALNEKFKCAHYPVTSWLIKANYQFWNRPDLFWGDQFCLMKGFNLY